MDSYKTLNCRAVASACALALASMASASELAAEPSVVSLIGYGNVKATLSQDGAVFECQDEEHADQLLSKLKADFTWDDQIGIREIKLSNGIPAYQLEGTGLMTLGRRGREVRVITGKSADALRSEWKHAGLGNPKEWNFAPARRHPASLDFFDLNALSLIHI